MCLHDGTLTLEDVKTMTDEQLETTLKMPVELVKKLLNKEKIVFFTNPPYGQAGSGQGKEHKIGATNTRIGNLMKKAKLNRASSELYTQFIYRVQLLTNFFEYSHNEDLRFFFFNKGFLTSPEFGEFVSGLTSQFSFQNGFMLNAGEFVGTSEAWGIIFSHWSLKGEKEQKTFPFKVLASRSGKEVSELTEWTARKVEKEETLTFWMKELGQNPIDKNKPGTKGGFEAPDTRTDRSRMGINALGIIMQSGNTVAKSNKFMGLFTMGVAQGNNYDVTRENFERTAITFSIRRAVFISLSRHKQGWIRDKDIFKRPPETILTDEFIADCVVYSLFDSQSNQTSLRNYEYNGNTYRVENEFFPFSIDFVIISNNNHIGIFVRVVGFDVLQVRNNLGTYFKDVFPIRSELFVPLRFYKNSQGLSKKTTTYLKYPVRVKRVRSRHTLILRVAVEKHFQHVDDSTFNSFFDIVVVAGVFELFQKLVLFCL